jgi:hypothetical protein
VYVADTDNHRIRKVDAEGKISTLAGTGTAGFSGDKGLATNAQLSGPQGVATDGLGNVFIADTENHRIRKVAGGKISTLAGTGTAGTSGDKGLATKTQLNRPTGVAVDASGNVYIADWGNHRILKVRAATFTTLAGTGNGGYSGDGAAATSAQLNFPEGMAIDGFGNVYIADYRNHRLRKVDTAGQISTLSGTGEVGYSGDGGTATSAQLNFPAGLAGDGSGNVYIADYRNNRIRKVNAQISTETRKPAAREEGVLPAATGLAQNYPNPFNPSTQIPYALAQSGAVSLQLYNVLGQQVRTLVQGYQPAGLYQVEWDGRDDQGRAVAGGIYIYQLVGNGVVESRRLLLLK